MGSTWQAELETRRPDEDPNGANRGGAEGLKGASRGCAEELIGLGKGGWRGRLGGTSGDEVDLELAWTSGSESWKETWSWEGVPLQAWALGLRWALAVGL